jgi:hypothetical protein
MAEKPDAMIAFEYLLGASKCSLENAMLRRLADERNRRKELMELLDAWAERRAEALLLSWFLTHGEALAGSLTAPLKVTEIKHPVPGDKPGPKSAVEFRETLRGLLNSA